MKSTSEIIDYLYTHINVSDVRAAISGKVYKMRRPVNSSKADIVIGCLPTNNLQPQTAVANINIYVPNLSVKVDGVQDISQPDQAKLRTLTTLVMGKIQDNWPTYGLAIESQNIFADDDIKQHYSNIRVRVTLLNSSTP